jgi:hypothetical protein
MRSPLSLIARRKGLRALQLEIPDMAIEGMTAALIYTGRLTEADAQTRSGSPPSSPATSCGGASTGERCFRRVGSRT